MSFAPQKQDELHSNTQASILTPNGFTESQITEQVVEYFKQKLDEHNLKEAQETQQYLQDELYKDLSSGFYQVSRKSQRDQECQHKQAQPCQQIKTESELLQKSGGQPQISQYKQIKANIQKVNQELEISVEQFMQKVLSPKLTSLEAPQMNQQAEFVYPSLMEQSNAENAWRVDQQASQQTKIRQRQALETFSKKENQSDVQKMNVQVNLKPENKKKKSKESLKPLITQDLLNIQSQQKPKLLALEVTANRAQQKNSKVKTQKQSIKTDAVQENTKLRILGYHKEHFLKIQTQVYQIQYSQPEKTYLIERKFSDFVLLDRLMRLKYPGYILYPFPQNSLEFFKKIKLSVGTEMEKVILLEKRLLELEKYLNFLFYHKQIGGSQLLRVFIAESEEQYLSHTACLQAQIDKEQQKFGESKIKQNYKNIKNLVKSGFSFFSNYISSSKKEEQNCTLLAEIKRKSQALKFSFAEVYLQLERYKLFTSNVQIKAQKLLEIYESNIEMKPLESSIDSVLRLSSKMTSSHTAYQLHKNWVEDKVLSKIYFFVQVFSQVEEQVEYRKNLLHKTDMVEQSEAKLGLGIIERVQSFDRRFIEDWFELKGKFEKQYFEMIDQFSIQWQTHCNQMAKIWK